MKFEIIYEDNDFVVVNKPSGMLTIPDRFGKDKESSLQYQLQQKFGAIMTVHRLDRETSGILVFARHAEAHRNLSMQFEHHSTDKYYLALVEGNLHLDEGEIDKPIGEHPSIPGKMAIVHTGKPSLTFYRALERFDHFTLAEVLIKTGRTHQIRVHFQCIGYPLAVDALYGRRAGFLLSEVKGKKYRMGKFTEAENPMMSRTSLHAYRLRLDHPVNGERMEFIAGLPNDFDAVLKQLRKWGKKTIDNA